VDLFIFLVKVAVISLSGVMAPGPVTAAAVGIGSQRRYAGAMITLGHGLVEFVIMGLILLGAGSLLKSNPFQITIGLAGGLFLLIMGRRMLAAVQTAGDVKSCHTQSKPLLAGLVLSAGNPYFLLWWATVGLLLATQARQLGVVVFALFAAVHWLCDFLWLQALSWTSFKGLRLFGASGLRTTLFICAAAFFLFGVVFLCDAGRRLAELFGGSG